MGLVYHAKFLATTLRLLRSQWWDADRIAAYQRDRLIGIMRHAVEHVPYYRRLGIRATDIESAADLQRFPILTKPDLQEHSEQFLSDEVDRNRLRHSRSSGVTGEPTTTYFDRDSWLLCKHALKARRVIVTTKSLRQRILIVSEQRSWPAVPALTGFLINIRGMSLTQDLQRNLRTLVRFEPNIVYGFPSYLLALADAAGERNIPLPQVRLICTSSEVLTATARQSLQRAFRGTVVDVYGSTEFKEIAVQCSHGRYHVNHESVVVESTAEGADGPRRLLVTTLVNKAMPLIRCELGDTGRIEQGACACGRSGPQLTDLHGRLGEVLTFPDGTRLSAYLPMVAIEQESGVKYFRIVHEEPWTVRIELLTRQGAFDASCRRLAAELEKILPKHVALKFRALSEREAKGKRRVVSREF